MPLVKNIHHGGIRKDGNIVKTFAAPNRQKLVYEINNWFFDFFYAGDIDIQQLPPLDDWTHSSEDVSCWSVKFPDATWEVWIRHEIMEF